MKLLPISCFALLLLAGCAGPEARWVRAGASPEQTEADYAACRAEARGSINRAYAGEVDRIDRMGGPPTLFGQSSSIMQSLQRDELATRAGRREQTELALCLRGKGYVQR